MTALVLMEHPNLFDTYVVARVVSRTPKTVQVRYWKPYKKEWSLGARRSIGAIVRTIYPRADDVTPDQLDYFAKRLADAETDKKTRIRLAKEAFGMKIRTLEIR